MDNGEIVKRIAGHIKDGCPMGREAMARCILAWYLKRTAMHVGLVKFFARLIAGHGIGDWSEELLRRVRLHDRDKLADPKFIGDYAPYIVKRYGPDWLKGLFALDDDYAEKWQTTYVVQHVKRSPHHPEYWCAEYGFGENTPPYSAPDMDEASLAEMCSDWMAVGFEQGNTASEWNKTTGKEKYIFTMDQVALLEYILSFEHEFLELADRLGLKRKLGLE